MSLNAYNAVAAAIAFAVIGVPSFVEHLRTFFRFSSVLKFVCLFWFYLCNDAHIHIHKRVFLHIFTNFKIYVFPRSP